MLVEKNVQQILNQLAEGELIKIPFDGSDIMIRFIDESSKLLLTALVFEGGDYIPKSVRLSLSSKSPFFKSTMLTFLTVDEQYFQVKLNYLGQAHSLTSHNFKELVQEFGLMAGKWRLYLDEHGKSDLIHVRTK